MRMLQNDMPVPPGFVLTVAFFEPWMTVLKTTAEWKAVQNATTDDLDAAKAGDHHFNYAWGHGGNLIIVLDVLDMVIVTTANPSLEVWGQDSWKHEGAIIDLVGKFIKSLPKE